MVQSREENGRLMMPVSIRLNHAIADGDLKTTLARLEVHMGRYRENLSAVQERYPDYFSMN